jgi:hypothetical protein
VKAICCVSVSSLVYCWVELFHSQRYSAVGFLEESWDTIFLFFPWLCKGLTLLNTTLQQNGSYLNGGMFVEMGSMHYLKLHLEQLQIL